MCFQTIFPLPGHSQGVGSSSFACGNNFLGQSQDVLKIKTRNIINQNLPWTLNGLYCVYVCCILHALNRYCSIVRLWFVWFSAALPLRPTGAPPYSLSSVFLEGVCRLHWGCQGWSRDSLGSIEDFSSALGLMEGLLRVCAQSDEKRFWSTAFSQKGSSMTSLGQRRQGRQGRWIWQQYHIFWYDENSWYSWYSIFCVYMMYYVSKLRDIVCDITYIYIHTYILVGLVY